MLMGGRASKFGQHGRGSSLDACDPSWKNVTFDVASRLLTSIVPVCVPVRKQSVLFKALQ